MNRNGDDFGRGFERKEKDIHQCGAACKAQNGCNAFLYSPESTQCYLRKEAEPDTDKSQHKDFLFCAVECEIQRLGGYRRDCHNRLDHLF